MADLRLPILGLPKLKGLGLNPQDDELAPEEQRSILGSAMGALQTAFNVLDTPRSMLWETLRGGNPLDVANPFNPESVERRPTGWDLTKWMGIEASPDAGFGERVLKGIPAVAAEVVGDPLFYLRGPAGALTKAGVEAGKAAKLEGSLTKGVQHFKDVAGGAMKAGRILGTTPAAKAQEIEHGLRSLAALKLPFAEGRLNIGTGKRAADIYRAMNESRYSPVPYLRSLVSSISGGVDPMWVAKKGVAAERGVPYRALGIEQHDLAYDRMRQIIAARNDVEPILQDGYRELSGLWDSVGKYARRLGESDPNGTSQAFANFDEFMRYIGETRAEQSMAGLKGGARERFTSMQPDEIARTLFPGAPGGPEMQQIGDLAQKAYAHIDALRETNNAVYDAIRELGGKNELLADFYSEHVARHANKGAASTDVLSGKMALHKYGMPESAAREAMFKVPGGTAMLDAISRDGLLTATDSLDKAGKATVRGELEKWLTDAGVMPIGDPKTGAVPLEAMQEAYMRHRYLEPERQALEATGRLGEKEGANWEKLVGQAATDTEPGKPGLISALGKYFAGQPEAIKQEGIFNRGVLQDWMDYQEHGAIALANLQAAHNLIRGTARLPSEFKGYMKEGVLDLERLQKEKGLVPLSQAWSNATIQQGKHSVPAFSDEGLATFESNFLAELQKNPKAFEELSKASGRTADSILVDQRLSDVLTKYVQMMSPDARSWLGKTFDKAQTMWRYSVTRPWPAFAFRNYVDTGLWRGIARAGTDTYSLPNYLSAVTESLNFARKWDKADLAALEFGQEFLKADVGLKAAAEYATGAAATGVKRFPMTIKEAFLGAGEAEQATGLLGKLGKPIKKVWFDPMDRMSQLSEVLQRYPIFAAAMKSGKSASQAAALTREIAYEYGKRAGGELATSFGNRYMRRVMPFWEFVKHNVPYQISQLANYPGGGHSMTLRLMQHAREGNEGGYVPKWMREQTGIRVGGTDEEANFIRSLGLSIEQGLGPAVFQGGNPVNLRSLQRAMSELSPMVQYPLKMLAGKDFYSGRDIKDLKGVTGKPWIDAAVQASPASRAVATLGDLLDERKSALQIGTNLITGIKTGTYDLPQQKATEIEQEVKRQIQEDPYIREFVQPYVPERFQPLAGPETTRRLEILAALARKRRAQMEKSPKPGGAYSFSLPWGLGK